MDKMHARAKVIKILLYSFSLGFKFARLVSHIAIHTTLFTTQTAFSKFSYKRLLGRIEQCRKITLKASFHSGKLSLDWNGQENVPLC